MVVRFFSLLLVPLLLQPAPKKTVATATGENEDLSVTATIHLDPEDIKQMLGSDLSGHFIVAEVKVAPKYGKEITIDRDDFQLRTDKDGERSKSFTGSQIAGRGALIIAQREEKKPNGWSLGGPVLIGGGAATKGDGEDKPQPKMKSEEQDNPLKKVLDSKILPEKKTDQPVAGLLYFPMEKQKMKDLELDFGGKENRISLRFKP